MAGRVPVDLLVVRAGRHHHPAIDARWRVTSTVPIRLIEIGPQLASAAFEKHRSAVHVVYTDTVKACEDRLRSGDLCHGAVIGAEPARVRAGMAGTACARRSKAAARDLDGAVGARGLGPGPEARSNRPVGRDPPRDKRQHGRDSQGAQRIVAPRRRFHAADYSGLTIPVWVRESVAI